MKRLIILIGLGTLIILFLICISKSTLDNDSPEKLYKKDNTADFLIYNDTVYINAGKIDWVKNLELHRDNLLGSIKRTKVTKNFKNFDATVLAIDTEVYTTLERKDILLVSTPWGFVPYYAYVEG